MIKKFFCDVETCGLDPKKNGVLIIGGIIEYGDIYEEFELKGKPFPEDEINPEALAVNKITLEEIHTFQKPEQMYHKFIAKILSHVDRYNKKDKFFFIAHNAGFDNQFLREFFNKIGDKYFGSYFFHPSICTQLMASLYLKPVRHEMDSFHLHDIMNKMNILTDEDARHKALGDTKMMRNLYYELLAKMQYKEYVV